VILSVLYFTINLIALLYVIFSVSFKLDMAAYIISLAFFLSFFFRLPLFLDQNLHTEIIPAVAQKFIWGSLYHFTFQMKRLKEKLRSESFDEY
jgi:hypothetical protein